MEKSPRSGFPAPTSSRTGPANGSFSLSFPPVLWSTTIIYTRVTAVRTRESAGAQSVKFFLMPVYSRSFLSILKRNPGNRKTRFIPSVGSRTTRQKGNQTMKFKTKVCISILAGLLAMLLSSAPMWWGVLFSPVTQPLVTAGLTEDADGVRWEKDGIVLRFKTLDLLFSFLHLS